LESTGDVPLMNRRAALKAGLFVAGTAWVAPVLEPLRLDAAAAQTASGVGYWHEAEDHPWTGDTPGEDTGYEGDAAGNGPGYKGDAAGNGPAGPAVRSEGRLAVLDQTTLRGPGGATSPTPRAQAVSAEIKLTG